MKIYKTLSKALFVCLAIVTAYSFADETKNENESDRFDGLMPVEDARMAMAYVDPDADFSVFKRVAILDPYVAFRANWQRSQNRSRSRNIRASDMDRIKSDVANVFRDVFIERLQDGGFEITTESAEDVLVLRPAIIDLDITAPDLRAAGRSRTYTATNGAATIYMELFDAYSGDLLGRAADRQTARQAGGRLSWNNRVTNTAEARRMFGAWADKLVAFLQENYGVKPAPATE